MAKQRNVEFNLKLVTDAGNTRAAGDFAKEIKNIEREAKAATAAVREMKKAHTGPARQAAGMLSEAALNKQDRQLGDVIKREEAYWAGLAKETEAARQKQTAAAEKAAADQAKIIAQITKAEAAELAKQDKEFGEMIAREEKYWADLAKATEKSRAEQTRATEKAAADQARATERAKREEAAAAAKSAREQLDAQQKLAAAQRNLLEGAKQTAGGMMMLVRSSLLMNAANTKSTEETLRMLAAFQSVYDLFSGSISVIQGVTKSYQAYAAAVTAAAAANKTLGVAAGANVLGMGATALGGVAAAAGGVWGGHRLAMNGFGPAGGPFTARQEEDYKGWLSEKTGFDKIRGLFGYKPWKESTQDERNAAAQTIIDQRNAVRERIRAGDTQRYGIQSVKDELAFNAAQLDGPMAARAEAERQRQIGVENMDRIRGAINNSEGHADLPHELMLASQAWKEAQQRVVDVDRERLGIAKQILSDEKARMDAIKEATRQSYIGIGQLDANQLRELEAAAGQVLKGQLPDREGQAGLRGLGVGEALDPLNEAEGLKNAGPNLRALIEQIAADRTEKAKEVNVKILQEIKGAIDVNLTTDKLVEILTKKIKEGEAAIIKETQKQIDEGWRIRDDQAALRRNNGL